MAVIMKKNIMGRFLGKRAWLLGTRTIFSEVSEDDLNTPLIPCRNRSFLPGSPSETFPDYLSNKPNNGFKGIRVSNKFGLHEAGKKLRKFLDANLIDHPAVLVRSLPITNAEDFYAFGKALGYQPMAYLGGTGFRQTVVGEVYSASDEPKEYTIEPHNEMSYLTTFPKKLMLWCASEGDQGGESPICFNRDLLAKLDKDMVQKITERKIRYMKNFPCEEHPEFTSWQNSFETTSKKEAESKMKKQNVNWTWNSDGTLTVWNVVGATINHPVTGENIWFNHVHANHCSFYQFHPAFVGKENLQPFEYYVHSSYGDGEEFEDEVMDHIRSVTWSNAMGLKLGKGDLLFLENMLCQHSRMSFEGPRKLLLQLFSS